MGETPSAHALGALRASMAADRGRPVLADGGAAADDLAVVDERDGAAWAIPYTDLTMLLQVFFVIRLSQAEPSATDGSTRQDLIEGIVDNLRSEPPSEAKAGSVSLSGGAGVLPGGEAVVERHAPPETALAAEWARRVGELEASVAAFLAHERLGNAVDLGKTQAGVELRMSDDVLFSSGTATLEARGTALVSRLAPLLREIDGVIEVTGHTDDVPIATARFPSKWELSAARAIAVVRLLRGSGVAEAKMQAVGHGANRPIASNDDPVGRAKNRRVTIAIAPRPPGS